MDTHFLPNFLKSTLAICALCLCVPAHAATNPTSYNNVFLTYVATQNVKDTVDYSVNNVLNGLIMWEFRSDMPYVNVNSLLAAAKSQYTTRGRPSPFILGYYTEWSTYQHYPVPGSKNSAGQIVTNADFTAKLAGMSAIAYSFLQVNSSGAVIFADPYASVDLNNFTAFAQVKQTSSSTQLYFSLGGAGASGNQSFANAFANTAGFITSVNSYLGGAHSGGHQFDGVDLDYENLSMTNAQAVQYLNLITALKSGLTAGKKLSVTVLANPSFLQGNNNVGFGCNTFKSIVDQADYVNLMTYDFHGAFDYPGLTGLQSNLYVATGDPNTNDFNINSSVLACSLTNPERAKISVGIPAYARSMTHIPGANGGLFQTIPSNSQIPQGDLDDPTCVVGNVPGGGANQCGGFFSYHFIVDTLLAGGGGFTQTVRTSASPNPGTSGTTAYAPTWTPRSNIQLQVTNTGTSAGGDLGITVRLAQGGSQVFGPSDWIGPNSNKVYTGITNPSSSNIAAGVSTVVTYTTYAGGPSGHCPQQFTLATGKTFWNIMVKVAPNGNVNCADGQL